MCSENNLKLYLLLEISFNSTYGRASSEVKAFGAIVWVFTFFLTKESIKVWLTMEGGAVMLFRLDPEYMFSNKVCRQKKYFVA